MEDGDDAGFYAEDAAMHGMILSSTGFCKLAQLVETAWANVDRARRLILPVPGWISETPEEHRTIVAALDAPGVSRSGCDAPSPRPARDLPRPP